MLPFGSENYRSFNSSQINEIKSLVNFDEVIGGSNLKTKVLLDKLINANKIYGVENGLVLLALLFNKKVTIFLGGGDFDRFHPFCYSFPDLKYIISSKYKTCFQCHWKCIYFSQSVSQVPCMNIENLDTIAS